MYSPFSTTQRNTHPHIHTHKRTYKDKRVS